MAASGDEAPTRKRVRGNIRRIRQTRGMTLRALAARTAELGWPLNLAALGRVETGERGVSVDDLMALSVALQVSPLLLLLPDHRSGKGERITPTVGAEARELWAWGLAEEPLPEHGTTASAPPADYENEIRATSEIAEELRDDYEQVLTWAATVPSTDKDATLDAAHQVAMVESQLARHEEQLHRLQAEFAPDEAEAHRLAADEARRRFEAAFERASQARVERRMVQHRKQVD